MGINFGNVFVEAGVFSIQRCKIDAALEVVKLVFECCFARAVPAVQNSILPPGPEEHVVRNGRTLMPKGSELGCLCSGGTNFPASTSSVVCRFGVWSRDSSRKKDWRRTFVVTHHWGKVSGESNSPVGKLALFIVELGLVSGLLLRFDWYNNA